MKPMDELEAMFAETGELDDVRALATKKILTADIRQMMDESNIEIGDSVFFSCFWRCNNLIK